MDIPISRSEQKRRIKQLEKLVGELSQLPPVLIDSLPCDDEISARLREVSSMKAGTRKRELKYITKLLKNESDVIGRLYHFMAKKQGDSLQDKKDFHEIEYIRDSLLNEAIEQRDLARERQEELEENWPSRILEEVITQYPEIDRVLLGRLAWMFARTRNQKHSREVFRILRAAQEQQKFAQK